jgi:secreted trypsin-like serine protease
MAGATGRLEDRRPDCGSGIPLIRAGIVVAVEALMRRLVLLVATLLVVVVPALPAAAITNGVPDGTAHPNVGGLVSPTQYSDGTWIYCSGTLISPTVFLTAAHCGEDGERVAVTFDPAYEAGDTVYSGTFQADPLYTHAQNDPHDIAVVVLDDPVEGLSPALLPEAGSLSDLTVGQTFTSVGYGAYEVTRGPGGHAYLYDDVRMRATGALNAVNPAWLRISMNPATGNGGTCYGDSGGPNFLDDSDIVAAITITGDAICRATNVVYRLDTASARAFLSQYVTLP